MDNNTEILAAQNEFNEFLKSTNTSESDLKGGEYYAVELTAAVQLKDFEKFDVIIGKVPKKHLYTEKLIPLAYHSYIERGLDENAYGFITAAYMYYKDNGLTLSTRLEDIYLDAPNDKLIERLKTVMGQLGSLAPVHIPKIIPKIHNEKYRLNEFILCDILSAAKVMRKKIKAVEEIIHEDSFNDVLVAILRLRLPIWGWDIADQERSGPSWAGKNAGEIDIVIKAAGHDLALIEALKMDGGDFTNLEKHILKIGEYSRDLKSYYMVIYYRGARVNFTKFCGTYQTDVAKVAYSVNWAYNLTIPYADISADYKDIEYISVGKTLHGPNNVELFHIIIDLSLK